MSEGLATSNAVEGLVDVVAEAKEAVSNLDQIQQRRLFCFAMSGDLEKAQEMWLKERGVIQSLEQVEEQALYLRNRSVDRCYFCSVENTHRTGWLFDPDKNTHMTWDELSRVACVCLDNFRSSRRVLFPNWDKRLEEISRRYHNGELSGDRVLYTDKCRTKTCGQPFHVTVRNAAIGWTQHRRFAGWNRCPDCVMKQKHQQQQQRIAGGGPTQTLKEQFQQNSAEPSVVVRRAPRLNALAPTGGSHGWAKLGDSVKITAEFERLKKKVR